MITLDNEIPDVVPVKNPILVKGETDNFVTQVASNQILTIPFNLPTTANPEIWKWKCGDLLFEFEWVASPDASGYQMPANLSFPADEVLLAEAINKCPAFVLIGASCTATQIGPTNYLFIEKLPADFDLEFIESTYATNDTVIQGGIFDIPSVAREVRQDFRAVMALYNNTITTGTIALSRYEPLSSLDSNPDNNDKIGWNLAPALRSELEWFMPDIEDEGFDECPGMSMQYLASIYEQYFNGSSQYSAYLKDLFPDDDPDKRLIALHSGMKFLDFDPAVFYFDYCALGANKKFLTYRPRISTFHLSEPIWLYFFLNSDIDIILNAKIYLANGTDDTTTLQTYTSDTDDGTHIFSVTCGVANNEELRDWIDGRDFLKMEIYLTWDDGGIIKPISEHMTFLREDRDWEDINYLLFESKLGGLDTFRITGNITFIDNSTGEVAQLGKEQVESMDFFRMVNNNQQEGFSINTGFRTKQSEIDWAREIQNSENVFLLHQGRLHRLILDRKEQTPYNLKTTLFSLDFQVKLAHYDRA